MSELVEREFPAKTLLFGLRAIGYNFSTAVADIIDNSVSAKASEIRIYSNSTADIPYFCIIDNGCGMSRKELDNAMLFGSDRTDKNDSDIELGRFGLGLKSASLSQCREFTVASKKYGKIKAMSFDLDIIEERNRLYLEELSDDEIKLLPEIDKLSKYETGAMVLWTKFDRIEDSAKNFEESFRAAVAESKKHVEFVFHRFYDEIAIFYNDKRIERRDPFLVSSYGRQQTGRPFSIDIDGSTINVTPYTLPYANSLTADEKKLLGNPKSIYDEQGFYLYRNRRLISWGSWMRMVSKSELNKLARIQVDIPSSLDSVWSLDVKKSSAKIPDKIKEQIKISINDSIHRSSRTTKFPGVKEQSVENKVWDRINEHDGKIRYQINRDTPAIKTLLESLGDGEKRLLEIALSQIECYLPKYSITIDNSDANTIVNSAIDIEEEHLIDEIQAILSMTPPDKKEKVFEQLFVAEGYQCLFKHKESIRRRLFGND